MAGNSTSDGARAHLRAMVALTALAMSLLAAGCSDPPDKTSGPGPSRPGDSAAQRAFLKEHGLGGKIVLMEFGLVGCELSEQGLDELMFLHREKVHENVAYVRVEAEPDKQKVAEYYAAKKLPFLMWHDPDTSLARAFDATVYPQFVLVGKFGRVRYRGNYPHRRLGEYVEILTAETTDPGPDVGIFGTVAVDAPKLLAKTSLPDLGGAVKSLKDYKGAGGLLMVFVDTTCPFSGEAIGNIPKIAGRLAGYKVPTVLVNLDDAEQAVRAFYKGRTPGAPVVYDVTTDTKLKWNIQFVPTVIFIDSADGVSYNGKAVWADLAAAAEKSLKLPAGTLGFKAKGTGFG